MRRYNKYVLILSSVVILLPILLGLFLWEELPAQMATHWGADGNVDGFGSRAKAVFLPPLLLLVLHWVCIFITARDPGNQNQDRKVYGMVLWICPVVSLLANGMVYLSAFGRKFDQETLTLLMLGLLFVVFGNYMPKSRRNHTIGIKVKWAMADDANWSATHRLGGKLWVAGGLLLMACVFLPPVWIPWVLPVLLVIMAVVPVVYSWWYYRRQVSAGTVPPKAAVRMGKGRRLVGIAGGVLAVVLLAAVAVLSLTGNVDLQYGETSFTVEASYWSDLTVDYAAVDSIEYRKDVEPGRRTNGFGSPRLALGTFENTEFGSYTRYSYSRCDAAVVLQVGERILVLSGKDAATTRAIFEALQERI